MILATIYIAGFFLCLIILSMFGKKLGVNYDDREDDWLDDFDSNASAYITWSFAWPLVAIFGSIALIWKGLEMLTKYLINKFEI